MVIEERFWILLRFRSKKHIRKFETNHNFTQNRKPKQQCFIVASYGTWKYANFAIIVTELLKNLHYLNPIANQGSSTPLQRNID